MKAAVVLYGDDNWTSQQNPNLPSSQVDIDPSLGFAKNLSSICDTFNINSADREQYTIQHEGTRQYIDNSTVFITVLQAHPAGKTLSLILRKKPDIRAQECVNSLAGNGEGAKEKDIVFQLRYALSDSYFAESFIDKGGVAALLRMVSRAKGNAQTYALHALRQCMEYVSGMSVVMGTPHLVKELFTLVDSNVVGVVRTALELLFVMCGYAKENGFVSVHRAAKATAKAAGKEPYATVISILGANQDLETTVNAFTLLNALLMTCPSDAKSAKLCKQWEKCGLHEKLRALTDLQDQTFQVQLENFEETTGVNLRSRASRLDAQCKTLKSKLREYEQQQTLVIILRDELRRIQHFVAEAWNDGTLITSAPMKRYLGPFQSEYPADLSFLKTAALEREKTAKLSEELAQLQSQLSASLEQRDALRAQSDTMRSQLVALQEASAIAQEQLLLARNAAGDAVTQATQEKASLHAVISDIRASLTVSDQSVKEALAEKHQFFEEKKAWTLERERLLAESSQFGEEKQRLLHERDKLIEERDQLRTKQASATQTADSADEQKWNLEKQKWGLEKQSLLDEKAKLIEERDQLLVKQASGSHLTAAVDEQKWSLEKERMLAESSKLIEEKRKLIDERDRLIEEREQLVSRHANGVQSTASADEEKWAIERERMLAQSSTLLEEKIKLLSERDELIVQRDQLLAKQASTTQPTSTTDEQKWALEREKLLAESSKLTEEKRKLIDEKNKLVAERDQLLAKQAHPTPTPTTPTTPNSVPPPDLSSESVTTPSSTPDAEPTPNSVEETSAPPPPPPAPPGPPGPPPPPGGKGPPPPPPPASKTAKPTKPPVTPSTKMRPLYWKRILLPPSARSPTVWDQVVELPLNVADLETKFAIKAAEKKKEEATIVARDKEVKEKPTQVFDPKKSNAISFMMAKLPSIPEIKEAISSMDDSKLSKDLISSLIANLPTQEEVAAIKETNVPVEKLDKPERFALEILGIPRIKDQLSCWLFLQEFSETTAPLSKHFKCILDCCKLTRSSSGLRKALGLVLAVGNYMNGGTARGQADGFALEALETLPNTKDLSNSMSLLDHISSIAVQQQGATFLADLEKELAPLSQAAAAPALDGLKEDLASVQKSTQRTRATAESLAAELGSKHQMSQKVIKQLSTYESSLSTFASELEQAEAAFVGLLEYYGYAKAASAEVSSNQFFGWVNGFVQGMAKSAEKEASRASKANKNAEDGPDKIGKKIAQGQDPLAALATAMKLGTSQLKKVPR